MFTDIFGQAMEAMRHNGRRTAITVIGMGWGIATVVLLLAYGAGFGGAVNAIFQQFGTNQIGIFPGAYKRAGWRREGRGEGAADARRCGAVDGDGAGGSTGVASFV